MAATVDEIERVRRMAGEVGSATYSDAALKATIERFACLDARGEEPITRYDFSTLPPSPIVNGAWMPTYDLAAAAAAVWEEKAAVLQSGYDFNVDGGSYQRSQMFTQATAQARYWRSRRKVGTVELVMAPRPVVLDAWGYDADE
jgi:hypothetical protein